MARRDEEREEGAGPRRWIWLTAVLLSLLINHTAVSLLPLPDLARHPPPGPVELDVYAPSEPAAPRPVDPVLSPPPPSPPMVALVAPPPPPDETPAQREERLRREEERERLPQVPPRVLQPPPQPEQPQPEPEPQEREEQTPSTLPEAINMHFVHLPPRTDEPETVPDDVRFFAQRTQDVDVETRAAVTTLDDSQEAAVAQARAREDQPQAPVDGESDARPQVDEREGHDATDREAVRPAPPQPVRVASQGGEREGRPGEREPAEPTPVRPEARAGGEGGTESETPRVAAAGVDAASQPEGWVAAEQESAERPGRPGEGPEVPGGPPVEPVPPQAVAVAGENGAGGRGGSGGGAGADTVAPSQSPDLDWATVEELFREQLDRERQAFLEQRRERRRMGGAMERMDRATAQLENFTPDVRPGNQTALDTLYQPFAEYITAFHRRMHPHWGDGFLASLATEPDDHPLNDMTLWVKLEIVVNDDGTIRKVTIVRPSGNTVYDVAAIDAVFQGEPYPSPPDDLQSGDGRLYLRWSFYRNNSQCGVWNAEPFILPDPPSLHEEGEPPDSEHPIGSSAKK